MFVPRLILLLIAVTGRMASVVEEAFMNIVVLDNDELAPGADFPPLDADKYGWIQYPRLAAEDIVATCWRTDVIVSLNTALAAEWLDGFKMIRMLIVGQPVERLLDAASLRARGAVLIWFGIVWIIVRG